MRDKNISRESDDEWALRMLVESDPGDHMRAAAVVLVVAGIICALLIACALAVGLILGRITL